MGQTDNAGKERAEPFKVEPFSLRFNPGIDPDKLNQLLDQLEVEDFLEKQRRDMVALTIED